MVLVTGGTGLVGAHLLYFLLDTHPRVRAIYRKEFSLEKVQALFNTLGDAERFDRIDWMTADITDIPSLATVFEGVEVVYHCAALISFDPNDYRKLKKNNIEGTANVVNLCLLNNVKTLCYVSSIAAIGRKLNGDLTTEETPWSPDIGPSDYSISKYAAEMEVWRGTQEGLPAVVVNPGVVLGSGFYDTGSGRLIQEVASGFKYRLSGITGYIDVLDVVRSMIELVKKGVQNQRYILVSENWAFEDFCDAFAKEMDTKKPRIRLSRWQLQIAWRVDWLLHLLFRKKRILSKQGAASCLAQTYYSHQKIKDELNMNFIPVADSIKRLGDELKATKR